MEKKAILDLLDKLQQFVSIASDWNLDEVEIDGKMIRTYEVKAWIDDAIREITES